MSEATENDGRGVKAEDDEYQLWPLNSEIGEPLDWLDSKDDGEVADRAIILNSRCPNADSVA